MTESDELPTVTLNREHAQELLDVVGRCASDVQGLCWVHDSERAGDGLPRLRVEDCPVEGLREVLDDE